MPPTSGNIQTINGTVGGKHGVFQNIACIGLQCLKSPDLGGRVMGLDSKA